MGVFAQDGATDRLLFKVESQAVHACARKFYQLKIFHILQAIDACNTVLYGDHGPDACRRGLFALKACDVFLYDGTDLISPRCHRSSS